MARKRRYTNKPKRKSSSPRAKPIKLDPNVWLRNSSDIAKYRESMLIDQDNMCAISFLPLDVNNSTLDHAHSDSPSNIDGKVRGCLESQVNMLEGRYLKLFKKARLEVKYGLDFPTFLINMGLYLQQDNSSNPYHYNYMTDLRNHIKRLTRSEIASKIRNEFNIEAVETEAKGELVRRYTQAFVDAVEYNEKLNKEKQNDS